MKNKLKIALLCDENLDISQAYGLSKLSEKIEISALLVQSNTKKSFSPHKIIDFIKRRGFFVFLSYTSFNLIQLLEKKALEMFFLKHKESKSSIIFKEKVYKDTNKVFLHTVKSKSGLVYTFNEDDINIVKELNLDLIIRCGSGILKGDILNIPKFGILSYHHGDNRWNRGGPPGFWEVIYKKSSSGVILQKLDENLDGGKVLIRGNFPTQVSAYLNMKNLQLRSNFFLERVISYIYENDKLPNDKAINIFSEKIYKYPNVYIQLLYLINLAKKTIKYILNKINSRELTWNLYIYKSSWKNLNLNKFIYSAKGTDGYKADPFLVEINGKNFCLYEFLPFNTRKGVINAIDISNNFNEIGTVLEENHHLSFPYTFKDKENTYILPESYESNKLTIYKLDYDGKLTAKPIKDIFKNTRCADSVVFKKDDLWWLLTNIDSSNRDDFSSELHCFFSDNLFGNNWRPHKSNPLIIDSECARNAGLIHSDNKIYRVFQKQGFNMYGEGFGISEIVNIKKDKYKEEVIYNLKKPIDNFEGMHTLNYQDGIAVTDAAERIKVK